MTIAFKCRKKFVDEAPAAMAVDKTARPQLVNGANPKYLKLLEEYKKITGSSAILNTSFNIHGDPIVCSPRDAIETYIRGGVEALIMGDFVVCK
jgi:carbamoyltransferase